MAANNSFDYATTDLLCNEETESLFFDVDDDNDESLADQNNQTNDEKGSEPLIYLPCLNEECIRWMVERERDHLPRDDYLMRLRSGELDVSLRRMALDWMFKACAHYNFGELCLYTAMSYLDRFLSVYELPVDKVWAIQLVAVACLSLAAKIEEVYVPSTADLQAGEPKFLFEAKAIQKMEILVLRGLQWKIKAYTPCNFIDYYIRVTNDGKFPLGPAINKSHQIIFNTIEGIEFLEFRPSEIAAAVAVHVSGETQAIHIDKAVSHFIGVDKERVAKCLELIQDWISIGGMSPVSNATVTTLTTDGDTSTIVANNDASVSSSLSHSPNGVLDAASLSYKSDETAVGSCPNCSQSSPDNKRRRLDQPATTTL